MRPVHWSDPFSLYRPWWISEHKSPCTYMFLVRVYRTHFTYSLSIASCCIICLAPTKQVLLNEGGAVCIYLPTFFLSYCHPHYYLPYLLHPTNSITYALSCGRRLLVCPSVSRSVGRSVRLSARSVRSVRPSTRASVRSVGPWVRPSIRPLVGWSFGHSVGWSGGRSVIRLVGRSVVLCP